VSAVVMSDWSIPAGRLGEGAEAAELALSTEASDFLAGQVIPISGGWVN
jgi:2-keto-3-deoxy-L-fuconate dehydrogenase